MPESFCPYYISYTHFQMISSNIIETILLHFINLFSLAKRMHDEKIT